MVNKKTLIAIVPARQNSKEIKNKNLFFYKKKRIINLALAIGLSLKSIHKVILSTDSKKIIKVTEKFHKKVMVIEREKKLALNKTPMHPVLKDAILKFETKYKKKVFGIIILDPTSPLRKKKDIAECIKKFCSKKIDLLLTVHKSDVNPYFSMVEKKKKYFQLLKGKNLNIGSRQEAPTVYSINTVCWIYSRRAVVDSKLRIPKKTLVCKVENNKSLELNTLLDKKQLSNL